MILSGLESIKASPMGMFGGGHHGGDGIAPILAAGIVISLLQHHHHNHHHGWNVSNFVKKKTFSFVVFEVDVIFHTVM